MKKDLVLSTLGHTWIIDLDGTIVKHNGYKVDGEDTFLTGAKEFLDKIPSKDVIIFLTSRTDEHKKETLFFLNKYHIRFDHIIFNVPYGERILINDDKPSGLHMSIAITGKRDSNICPNVIEDDTL